MDDKGRGNIYTNTLFWMNKRGGGISPGRRFEMDILDGAAVTNCFLSGEIDDLRGSLDRHKNVLDAPDPEFDDAFRPTASAYVSVGYRPADR